MEPVAVAGERTSDEARRRRLRWRARRGLLENDLVLTRFLDAREAGLADADVAGLDRLLDLTDNELLDLILGRSEPDGAAAEPDARRVLGWLREA
jgi:antitoxin CptB